MLKKSLSLTAYLAVVIILGLTIRHFAMNVPSGKPAISAAPLFNTPLTDIHGSKQNLSQYKGKIIVLNFWATWCPPCREEMPELSQLHLEYKDRNVVVLGVAEDDLAPVKEYLQLSPVAYPVFIAENESADLGMHLGNDKSVLPYTVIIGTDGNVIDTFFGRINKPLLEKSLQILLPQQKLAYN